ncbi:hypothetical protein AvCA_28900 [Azotobacter vinelandii CA]|uniref:Uncharacterized protein n=2 Tax=Azotobacter vinelandii TaxID=354 RepID=C1DLX4_AZOVD|nr:hypothetical protein [Azotobacter vinelandii]ACO79061.1 hypothetical protein Avin_28900 [Azotobacter vinelandii DJ]AGK16518.1 hypothetical protein AvCA_28900 [Azotobacter vinelandii CA]AGK20935.1 hypothetical protein AvCA6_28900 [Azotobacter vinelandii CA6]WKN20041.1 hypothetical protein AVAEIV_002974 [Azotobacter vinelandii]
MTMAWVGALAWLADDHACAATASPSVTQPHQQFGILCVGLGELAGQFRCVSARLCGVGLGHVQLLP